MKTLQTFFVLFALLCLTQSGCKAFPDAFRDGGGWTMKHPTMHLVFWGSYWQSYPAEVGGYTARWDALMNTPGDVLDRLAEYGVQGGAFDTAVALAAPAAAGNIPTTVMLGELNDEIITGVLPTPSADTLYVIMLPPGATTDLLVQWGSRGYHAASVYGGTPYAYAVVEYGSTDVIVSHELYEAATDPAGLGWVNRRTGQEIADACASHYVVQDGATVATAWSQAQQKCL